MVLLINSVYSVQQSSPDRLVLNRWRWIVLVLVL